jgi:catechol 2,3-dioxygenase-like lactoylglutathione lyase family enzyme
MPINVESLDHLVVNVTDVAASARWYERVLNMTRVDSPAKPEISRTSMNFGSQKINLRPIHATQQQWFTARNAAAGHARRSPSPTSRELSCRGSKNI